MHTGHYISGAGHLGLIAWLLLGNIFTSRPEPFKMQEVSVISAAEFDAMVASAQAPEQSSEVDQPVAAETSAQPPEVDAPSDQAIEQPTPLQAEAPPPDPVPEVAESAPPPPSKDISQLAPEAPEPPAEVAVLVPEKAPVAVPRPVERVAPEAVAPPDPAARPDVIEQEATTPDATAEKIVEEAQEATAPEEATTQIVTEATEAPKAAPEQSPRPPARRPTPPAPEVVETAVDTPKPTPAKPAPAKPEAPKPDKPKPKPAPAPSTDKDAVAAALAEALGSSDAPATAPATPSGPPLSAGEKEALRVAVSSCWNVGSLSSEALRTTVVVSVAMNQDGTPQTNSITMTSSSGGTQAAAGQAFEAARRAIIRCGARGYQLPVDKFGQWQNIEMTFNPERMRIK
ncbi:MAG: energy transducer TonB [Sulfitobacter sp.]|uniref:energy transducer TonB n=1 Tax=Sulfitobacter sp. TaxID=1903071 RepID=UPI004058B959